MKQLTDPRFTPPDPNEKVHELKILPPYYEDVANEKKTFEVRKNDRDFEVGDKLILRDWNPETGYSGRWVARTIVYMVGGAPWLPDDVCVLGIEPGYVVKAPATLRGLV